MDKQPKYKVGDVIDSRNSWGTVVSVRWDEVYGEWRYLINTNPPNGRIQSRLESEI